MVASKGLEKAEQRALRRAVLMVWNWAAPKVLQWAAW